MSFAKRHALLLSMLCAWGLVALARPEAAEFMPRFLAFLAVMVVLPGYALARRLLDPQLRLSDRLIFGLVGGTASLVAFGLIGARLGRHDLTWAQLPLAVWGGVELVRDWRAQQQAPEPESTDLLAAGLYLTVITLVLVQFLVPTRDPSSHAPALYYQDSLWTLGNTQALERFGLPLHDLRMAGVTRSYHVAQNVFQVAVHGIAGVPYWQLHFAVEPAWDWFVLVLVVVRGARVFLNLAFVETALLAAFLLLASDLQGSPVSGGFFNPLSYLFGLPAFFLLHFLLGRFLLCATRIEPFAALALLLATAAKSTLIAYVGAAGGLTMVWLFFTGVDRARVRTLFFFLLSTIPIAVLMKLTCLSVDGEGYFTLWEINPDSFFYRLVYERLSLGAAAPWVYGVYRFTKPFLAGLAMLVAAWPIAAVVALGVTLWRKRVWPLLSGPIFYALAFTLLSVGTISVLHVKGGVPYFYLYPQLLLLLVGVLIIDRWPEATGRRRWRIAASVALAAGLVVTGRNAVLHAKDFGAWPGARQSLWDPLAAVTRNEWDAVEWLRANGAPGSCFFSNRRSYRHEREGHLVHRYFFVSARTGLQSWVEGDEFFPPPRKVEGASRWATVQQFLEADSASRAHVLEMIPARYFIQYRRVSEQEMGDVLKLVFENPDVRIYERPGYTGGSC